jgi:hypothetical protein
MAWPKVEWVMQWKTDHIENPEMVDPGKLESE